MSRPFRDGWQAAETAHVLGQFISPAQVPTDLVQGVHFTVTLSPWNQASDLRAISMPAQQAQSFFSARTPALVLDSIAGRARFSGCRIHQDLHDAPRCATRSSATLWPDSSP